MTEFLTLFVADDSPKVLNLNQPLSNKDHLRHFGNPGNPGIANQLRIERQQSFRFFWIAAGSGFPFEQTTPPVEFADCVNVGHELVVPADRKNKFDLQVVPWLADADAVFLTETLKQLNALLQHSIPTVILRILQILLLARRPFAKEHGGGVFTAE